MGLFVEKIAAILIIFAETVSFVLIPILNNKFKSSKQLMAWANSFSGGIFISAGLFHILPDAVEAYEKALKKAGMNVKGSFPWPYFSCLMSFAFVFLIDKVIVNPHQFLHSQELQHDSNHQQKSVGDSELPSDFHPGTKEETTARDATDDAHFRGTHQDETESRIKEDLLTEGAKKGPDMNSSIYPYILVLAMGIHSSFSGLALGVMDEKPAFYGFLIAIVVHKWAEALTVGISFSKSNIAKTRMILLLAIFSVATPSGIVCGLILNKSNHFVKAILSAISAGTFVYISAVEIIVEEFSDPENRRSKFLMFILGNGFMVFIWFLEQWTGGDGD